LAGLLCLLPAFGAGRRPPAGSAVPKVPAEERGRVFESYGRLSVAFQANQGQSDPSVRFLSRGRDFGLFLTQQDAVLALRKGPSVPAPQGRARPCREADASDVRDVVVRMKLAGSNPRAAVEAEEPLEGIVNYFIGKDPKNWRTNIRTFGRVRYRNVYPGIDLVYYGNNRRLEYDLALAAGADPGVIRLSFDGVTGLEVDGAGDLVLHSGEDRVVQKKPVA